MKKLILTILVLGSAAQAATDLKFSVFKNEYGTDTVIDYTAYAQPKLIQIPESVNSDKFCEEHGGTIIDGFEIENFWFDGLHCLVD